MNKKGNLAIFVAIVVTVVAVLLGLWFVTSSPQSADANIETEAPLSKEDDPNSLEKDLQNTSTDSVDRDLESSEKGLSEI